MAWSETLGQVMQTRPILAYGASLSGRGGGHRQSLHPGQHSLGHRLRRRLCRGQQEAGLFLFPHLCGGAGRGDVHPGGHGGPHGHHVRPGGHLLVFCGGGHPHGHGPAVVRHHQSQTGRQPRRDSCPSAPA